jgi:hypothetical protein
LFVGLLRKSEVLSLGGVRRFLGSDSVGVVEVPARVLLLVGKEASADEGETVLVAAVVRGVVSTVSMPMFCPPLRVS